MFELDDVESALLHFRMNISSDDEELQVHALKTLPVLLNALDEQQAQQDLLPLLESIIEKPYCHDEVLLNLAEQMGNLVEFIGGSQNAHMLFNALGKLASTEHLPTREKTIDSLRLIAESFDEEQIKSKFIPLILNLSESEWFTSKCSAAGLYAVVYQKISEESRENIRASFRQLCQDDSPMVRRSCAESLLSLLDVLEDNVLRDEIIPLFDQFANDVHDTVRVRATSIGLALAKKFTENETKNYILKNILNLGSDKSWRVRLEFMVHIPYFQTVLGPEITKKELIPIFVNLSLDAESYIRGMAAKKLVDFCSNLQSNYERVHTDEELDPVILSEFLPIVKRLNDDVVEDVREELSSTIPALAALLGPELSKTHLLPLITEKADGESSRIQLNVVLNLNNLLSIIGVEDLTDTIQKIMKNLMDKSEMVWRAKRNLISTLCQLVHHTSKDYFDDHLSSIYINLLSDARYSVRRIAPIVLPFFAKHFGATWMEEFLRRNIFVMAEDNRYLWKINCLLCIDELIMPYLDATLQSSPSQPTKFLAKLQKAAGSDDAETKLKAARIAYVLSVTLPDVLIDLGKEWVKSLIKLYPGEEYYNDNVHFYGEETIIDVERYCSEDIIAITDSEIENEEDRSYLEGIFAVLPETIKVINFLRCDKVENVKLRAARSIAKIIQFVRIIEKEITEPWLEEAIAAIPEEDEIFSAIRPRTRSNTPSIEKISDDISRNPKLNIIIAEEDRCFHSTDYEEEDSFESALDVTPRSSLRSPLGSIEDVNSNESETMTTVASKTNGEEDQHDRVKIDEVVEEETEESNLQENTISIIQESEEDVEIKGTSSSDNSTIVGELVEEVMENIQKLEVEKEKMSITDL